MATELTLQTVAFLYRHWATQMRRSQVQGSDFRILCLGDSHTFGVGALPRESYPRQLENRLRARWPGRDIQVINAGVPGANSSMVLDWLEHHLAHVRPHMVLLMVGVNDVASHRIDLAVLSRLPIVHRDAWLVHVRSWLHHRLLWSRLYRVTTTFIRMTRVGSVASAGTAQTLALEELQRLCMTDPESVQTFVRKVGQMPKVAGAALCRQASRLLLTADKSEGRRWHVSLHLAHLFRAHDNHVLCRTFLEQARAQFEEQKSPESRSVLADVYLDLGDLVPAQTLIEQLLLEEPGNVKYRLQLARACFAQRDLARAMTLAQAVIATEPRTARAHGLLASICTEQGDFETAREYASRMIELSPRDQWGWRLLADGYRREGKVELQCQALRQRFLLDPTAAHLLDVGLCSEDPKAGMRTLLAQANATSVKEAAYYGFMKPLIMCSISDLSGCPLATNRQRIADEVQSHGVRLGLITYPHRPVDFQMNVLLREAADVRPGIMLIDAAKALYPAFSESPIALISADKDHPNGRGYAVLAEEVARALEAASGLFNDRWVLGQQRALRDKS